ncbi:MAG: SusD/RagB family nutrient-binding outer membrane lipoprotein [Bacteroidia bacterium]
MEAQILKLIHSRFSLTISVTFPLPEAIKGTSDILSPKYDSQEAIYNGIISTSNQFATLDETAVVVPGADDLIFQGDIALWREFATHFYYVFTCAFIRSGTNACSSRCC